MKLYTTLIFSAISLAFLTGYLTFFLQGNYDASAKDIYLIKKLKYEFNRIEAPIRTINFKSAYFLEDQFQLLNTSYASSSGLKKGNVFSSSKKCFKNILSQFSMRPSFKEFIWEEFRCGLRKNLPRNFFLRTPFLHSSGFSYTFLAYSLGNQKFRTLNWLNSNLGLFHVNEVKYLITKHKKIKGTYRWISERDSQVLSGISKGEDILLSNKYLFLRVLNIKNESSLIYRVYNKNQLEKFTKKYPYTFKKLENNTKCLYKDRPLCWNYNSSHLFKMANTSTKIIFISTLCLIFLVIMILFNRLKIQKVEEERKRMALQVLTHEFRTPIASLLLQLGQIEKKMSYFDEETQGELLGIANDIYRLQRLAEKSKNYLNIQNNHNLFHFQVETIPSINEYLDDFLAPFLDLHGDQIIFKRLAQDRTLTIDPYWLGIILKNLLENAINHGKMPIVVSLSNLKKNISISILDHGECQIKDLNSMTAAFYKGQKSKGTGLGMNIVKKIVAEMGGKLQFKDNPTEFIIIMKNMSRGNKDGKNTLS